MPVMYFLPLWNKVYGHYLYAQFNQNSSQSIFQELTPLYRGLSEESSWFDHS